MNDTCAFSVVELQHKLICKDEEEEEKEVEEINEPRNETEKMNHTLAQLRK